MKAENTLQFMADFYPDLFPTRKHAIVFLFCITGNGYEWKDGELVDTDSDGYEYKYRLIKDVDTAVFRREESWWAEHRRWNILHDVSVSHDVSRIDIPIQYQFNISKPSKTYSYFYNYPDNIKPDWMKLLKECKEILDHYKVEYDEVKV